MRCLCCVSANDCCTSVGHSDSFYRDWAIVLRLAQTDARNACNARVMLLGRQVVIVPRAGRHMLFATHNKSSSQIRRRRVLNGSPYSGDPTHLTRSWQQVHPRPTPPPQRHPAPLPSRAVEKAFASDHDQAAVSWHLPDVRNERVRERGRRNRRAMGGCGRLVSAHNYSSPTSVQSEQKLDVGALLGLLIVLHGPPYIPLGQIDRDATGTRLAHLPGPTLGSCFAMAPASGVPNYNATLYPSNERLSFPSPTLLRNNTPSTTTT